MKTFVLKDSTVKAKLFDHGDQDGFVYDDKQELLPFAYTSTGKVYATFKTHVMIYKPDNTRVLISLEAFNELYKPLEK